MGGEVPGRRSCSAWSPADCAGRALLDQAARAQLVVVGSRGHGEIAGLLLDSVSNALVHGAGCPVAIVRATK